MTIVSDRQLHVAVGGFGAIGRRVAQALDSGIPGLRLAAISARDTAKAKQGMSSFAHPVPIVPLKDLAAFADIVVDAAPADALREGPSPLCVPVGGSLSSASGRFCRAAISSNLRDGMARRSSCRAARCSAWTP